MTKEVLINPDDAVNSSNNAVVTEKALSRTTEQTAHEWETRLRSIRTNAHTGVGNAIFGAKCLCYCGLVTFTFPLILAIVMSLDLNDLISYNLFQLIIPLLLLIYCFIILVTIDKVSASTYAKDWGSLRDGWLARLYADEELHRVLQVKLDQATLLKQGVSHTTRRFEQQLEFCACHLDSLARLARDPEARLSSREISAGRRALRMQGMFGARFSRLSAIGCMMVCFMIGPAMLFALFMLVNIMDYIRSRSRMMALIDYMLECPDRVLMRNARPSPVPMPGP